MKLSVMTVMAPDLQLPELVALMKEIGFDGIEPAVGYTRALWNEEEEWHLRTKTFKDDLFNLKNMCAPQIEICSLASGFSLTDQHALGEALSACRDAGVPMARCSLDGYCGKAGYPQAFAEAKRSLEKAIPLAERFKVKLVFETHMHTFIPSASAAFRLLGDFDPASVGVVLDFANSYGEGFEEFGIHLLGPYIAHVHVKNLKWMPDPSGQASYFSNGSWMWEVDNLRTGIVNWKTTIGELRDIGYNGYLSLENFMGGYRKKPEGTTTEAKLREDFAYLKEILKPESAC